MEAITIQLLHKFGDGSASDYRSYTGRDLTGEYYPKPEADAVIARLEAEIARYKSNIDTTEAATGMCGIYAGLEHQIEVLNADLTRCQDSKTAIGDKCLRLVDSLKEIADSFGSTGEDAINFREWAKQALSGGRRVRWKR